jgi:Fe-S-cluster containining protein
MHQCCILHSAQFPLQNHVKCEIYALKGLQCAFYPYVWNGRGGGGLVTFPASINNLQNLVAKEAPRRSTNILR